MRMHLLKRAAAVVLALALAATAVGCGSSTQGISGERSEKTTKSSSQTTQTSESEEETSEEASETSETANPLSGLEKSSAQTADETEEKSTSSSSKSEAVEYKATAQEGTDPLNSSEGYDNLFDHDLATKWCTTLDDSGSAYVIWQMEGAVSVEGYLIGTGNDTAKYTGRNPVSWILLGAKADSLPNRNDPCWEVIDTVSQDTTLQAVNQQLYEYRLSSATQSYNCFMLMITDIGSDSDGIFQISEFSLEYDGCSYDYDGVYSFHSDGASGSAVATVADSRPSNVPPSIDEVVSYVTLYPDGCEVGNGSTSLYYYAGSTTEETLAAVETYIDVLSDYGYTLTDSELRADVYYCYYLDCGDTSLETVSYRDHTCRMGIEAFSSDTYGWQYITVIVSPSLIDYYWSGGSSGGGYSYDSDDTYSYDGWKQASDTKIQCTKCYGSGTITCTNCGGSGYKEVYVSTPNYSGHSKTSSTSRETCYKCHGSGTITCTRCGGSGYQ